MDEQRHRPSAGIISKVPVIFLQVRPLLFNFSDVLKIDQ